MYPIAVIVTLVIVAVILLDVPVKYFQAPDPLTSQVAPPSGQTPDRNGRSVEGRPERTDDQQIKHKTDRETVSSIDQQSDFRAVAEQAERSFEAERVKTARLSDELASSERTATERILAVRQRLDSEQVRSTALLRDLGQARERIARAFPHRIVRADRREAREPTESSEDARLIEERIERAANPSTRHDAMPPMAVRLSAEAILVLNTSRSTIPDGAATIDARGELPSPGPVDVQASIVPEPRPRSQAEEPLSRGVDVGAPSSPVAPAIVGAPATAALPDGVPARVTVGYVLGSESARKRALALSQLLKAQGMDAAEPVDMLSTSPIGRVTYYYDADQASAERVAELSATARPIRGRLPAGGRLPRPGTIEVAVAK